MTVIAFSLAKDRVFIVSDALGLSGRVDSAAEDKRATHVIDKVHVHPARSLVLLTTGSVAWWHDLSLCIETTLTQPHADFDKLIPKMEATARRQSQKALAFIVGHCPKRGRYVGYRLGYGEDATATTLKDGLHCTIEIADEKLTRPPVPDKAVIAAADITVQVGNARLPEGRGNFAGYELWSTEMTRKAVNQRLVKRYPGAADLIRTMKRNTA